ncbi:MAG TPA: protein-L-isoaspartate(D-aspartate) O-methyltransferase [Pirellulales bacterium]|nr:protein-L-isoaspartate(D-aspartate) O-methyltransferase [Pirellulales bacterium]
MILSHVGFNHAGSAYPLWYSLAAAAAVCGAGLVYWAIWLMTLGASEPNSAGQSRQPPSRKTDDADEFAADRQSMVDRQLRARDIDDPEVLAAFNRVPRHRFVPPILQHLAYADEPLPIGHAQTISQPYVVALMTQLAKPKRHGRALDVGVGSGYQTAVLAELCDEVYGIEIIGPLAEAASRRLAELGYKNVEVRTGDGYRGWPEHAPFDCIIVAAAADHVPQPLIDQLAPGGRLVLPVGHGWQELAVIEKQDDGSVRRLDYGPVAFVPMTGEAERK